MARVIKTSILHGTPHLVAILMIWACLELSAWQSDRADQKADLIDQWENAPQLIIQDLEDWTGAPTYAQVELTGRFEPIRHVLLDNQTRQNHPGVHVYSPFLLGEDQPPIFVNRGWQPWLRYAGQWPDYPTPIEPVTLTGRIAPAPNVGFQLGEAAPLNRDQWPNLMTYFDIDQIRLVFGSQVSDHILLLDPTSPYHLSKDPWPRVNMSPDRHRAYAFQWQAIALAILVIWIALSFRVYRSK